VRQFGLLLTQVGALDRELCFQHRVSKYFFNFAGDGPRDDTGLELRDAEAAFIEAVRGARSCMADGALKGALSFSDEIEVSDEYGRVLFVVPFTEAVRRCLARSV
jgi:hypothetical protein